MYLAAVENRGVALDGTPVPLCTPELYMAAAVQQDLRAILLVAALSTAVMEDARRRRYQAGRAQRQVDRSAVAALVARLDVLRVARRVR